MPVGEVFLSDNSGNRIPPHPHLANPIPATGQLLDADTGAAKSIAVVGGQHYLASVRSSNKTAFFGVADCNTDANKMWVCLPYSTILIVIPVGIALLYYNGDNNNTPVHLRRIYSNA